MQHLFPIQLLLLQGVDWDEMRTLAAVHLRLWGTAGERRFAHWSAELEVGDSSASPGTFLGRMCGLICLDQRLQIMADGPHLTCLLFFYGSQAKNDFYIFEWLEKNHRRIIF